MEAPLSPKEISIATANRLYGEVSQRTPVESSIELRNCDAILNEFEQLLLTAPTSTDTVLAYHAAVLERKAFARAEAILREALNRHPHNKPLHLLLIDLICRQQDFHGAMPKIEAAIIDFGIDDGILQAALAVRSHVGPHAARGAGISLCMIVKNEEEHLAQCLMSVKSIVSEMIVVDTGSTDKTKAIASALGAKVFDFPWAYDFSEARNYSLSKASGNWILVLDADEIVSPSDHDKLKKLIKNKAEKRVAYIMVTRNYTNQAGARGWAANEGIYIHEESGRGWFPSLKVRLFVNDKRINFVNPVHEFVEPTLQKLGIKIKICDVPVHHYGRLNQSKLIAKGKEYFRIGITKIEKTKGDYKALTELAIQASEIGEYEEAVNVWQKVIELKSNDAVVFMNMGFAFLMMKQYDKAMEHSKKAMDLDPDLKEAALNYAAAELIAGDVRKAISTLENILKKHLDYPPAMGRLAAACMIDGRKEEGVRYLDRLTAKGFDCPGMLEEQSRSFHSEGKIEQALVLLQEALERRKTNSSTHALLAECRQKMKGSVAKR
jgi:glycosyltransferase involved in cell wall biosynthesis